MNIISSFSFTEQQKPILEEFKKIAQREGMSKSQLAMKLIEEHVKSHSAGNSTFKITDFEDPDFKAMPATMSPDQKWNEYIRKHMDQQERKELEHKAKYMLKIIDAQNWLDDRK